MRNRYVLLLVFFLKSLTLLGQQDTVQLYIPDTTVLLGNSATIEVRVSNFNDIISMQASINWDPALASFVELSGFGLQDLGINNFGTTNAAQGHIRFVWEPSNAVAQSLPDSSVLFTMTFESSAIEPLEIILDFEDKISTPAFPVEFADANYNLLTVQTFPGKIQYYEVITGLQTMSSNVIIYPNPFMESINIRNDHDLFDYVKVYTLSGEVIAQIYNPEEPLIRVPMRNSSAGIYFVYLKLGDQVFYRKVVKRNPN